MLIFQGVYKWYFSCFWFSWLFASIGLSPAKKRFNSSRLVGPGSSYNWSEMTPISRVFWPQLTIYLRPFISVPSLHLNNWFLGPPCSLVFFVGWGVKMKRLKLQCCWRHGTLVVNVSTMTLGSDMISVDDGWPWWPSSSLYFRANYNDLFPPAGHHFMVGLVRELPQKIPWSFRLRKIICPNIWNQPPGQA